MLSKSEEKTLLIATPLPGVDLVVIEDASPFMSGSGGRQLRKWMHQMPCCENPCSVRMGDGRWRCKCCSHWFSVSHSGCLLALARAEKPVGVDVQHFKLRPAALRWLARISAIKVATIPHWAAMEAILKAIGQAWNRPISGWIELPEKLSEYSILQLSSDVRVELCMSTVEGAALALCQVGEDILSECSHQFPVAAN